MTQVAANKRPVGLYVNSDGDLATPIEAQTASFSQDEWHHVLITWDGDVGSVFVDGKLDNQVLRKLRLSSRLPPSSRVVS